VLHGVQHIVNRLVADLPIPSPKPNRKLYETEVDEFDIILSTFTQANSDLQLQVTKKAYEDLKKLYNQVDSSKWDLSISSLHQQILKVEDWKVRSTLLAELNSIVSQMTLPSPPVADISYPDANKYLLYRIGYSNPCVILIELTRL
jgi:hypothetical protein